MTSYNGQSITYDAIGNPLTYNGKTYTWERGNELAGISGGGLTAGYKYNSDGIRTVKTVNGVTTKYHLVGDKVTYESNGNDTIYYSYDPNGMLVSMNLNGTEYFYVRNAQGDIIKIVNASGTVVVSYVYDTWGKLISTTGTLASTVGAKNPYRYRGYRYDTETGLHYLQSRYYNPEWGRFLNADSLIGKPGVLLSHNVFAYCGNNPVNNVDPSGEIWEWAQKGRDFAEQVYNQFPGFIRNTESSITSYGKRIPDFINSKVIDEIKNVNYQYLSSQIKGFLEIAKKTPGKTFVFSIREGATLSAPLEEAIREANGVIIKVAEKASGGMKMIPLLIPENVLNDYMNQMNGGDQST